MRSEFAFKRESMHLWKSTRCRSVVETDKQIWLIDRGKRKKKNKYYSNVTLSPRRIILHEICNLRGNDDRKSFLVTVSSITKAKYLPDLSIEYESRKLDIYPKSVPGRSSRNSGFTSELTLIRPRRILPASSARCQNLYRRRLQPAN